MPFLVSASGPGAAISVSKDTPKEALEKAIELLGGAATSVRITDLATGRQYSPSEFTQFLATPK